MACFRSNGKLMISGEYLVLKGASALAIPVRYGQSLRIRTRRTDELTVSWTTYVQNREYLQVRLCGQTFDTDTPAMPESKQQSISFIQKVLRTAREINPSFPGNNQQVLAESHIDFDLDWGLGSSSSLISNIAWWADTDPYQLFFKVANGSGYDIACARSNKPIIYNYNGKDHPPLVRESSFNPSFGRQLFFVYSGQKQDSEKSIREFNADLIPLEMVDDLTEVTNAMATTGELGTFIQMMRTHEEIVSKCLGKKTVQEVFFPDFPGAVKSLGAWGGDFLLAAAPMDLSGIKNYFIEKGLQTIIPFHDMRL